jgi:hypothetical protein
MTRQIITGLALSLALAASSYGGPPQQRRTAQAGTDSEITVRIHNYAKASRSVVLHAERIADIILREAGVSTDWVECPVVGGVPHDTECDKPFSSLDFVLTLLPRAMSDRLDSKGGVLGLAVEASRKDFGFSAYIFYDIAIDRVAQGQDLDQLLGTAIAHELGHLLLGTNSHSETGLMSAFWSGKQLVVVQQRGLAFSSAEAERIQRAVLTRRLAVQSATSRSELVTIGLPEKVPGPSSSAAGLILGSR